MNGYLLLLQIFFYCAYKCIFPKNFNECFYLYVFKCMNLRALLVTYLYVYKLLLLFIKRYTSGYHSAVQQ